jgi:hypothetical protein
MKLIFPDQGLVPQLSAILNAGLWYGLFTDAAALSLGDVMGTHTEAAFAGYARQGPLTAADFTIFGVIGHKGYAIAAPVSFLNTSGVDQNVFGYFVSNLNAGGFLIAIARFDGPPLVIHNTDTLQVIPVWGDFSELTPP